MCNLKNWWVLNDEEIIKKRWKWGCFFIVMGIALLVAPVINWKLIYEMIARWVALLWVVGWSSLGIGIGLINSRARRKKDKKEESRDDQHLHYIFYYLIFALPVVSLAAYSLGNEEGVLSRPLSALIGLTFGFAVEKLNELGIVQK